MGPKKASKGSKGAGSAGATGASSAGVDRDASVVATNEYPLAHELRKRVEEAEAQLREEAKIIERMTRDNRAKQEQINQMEALLAREMEKHQAAARMQEDEALTQRLQAEHEIEVLRRKVSQLELHVEAYDVLEASNRTLRERVERLMQQLEEENRSHAEEIHKVRLDMFNHKMALEKTFRKALQELDAEYLKKAFNAMSEESKNALVANAKLKDELQLQSIGVDNLMQRFNQQAKHYQKMRIENDILEQESHLRLQEVSSMKKAQLEATRTIERLRDDVQREEQEWRQQANKTIEELRRENQHLTRLHEMAQKRCHKWKTRCMELADRETQRRLSHHEPSDRSSSPPPPQRAQTAPLAVIAGFSRSQSQPVLGTTTQQQQTPGTARNYDELWSASLAHKAAPTERASTAQDTTSLTARPSSRRATRVVLPRNPQLVEFNFAR